MHRNLQLSEMLAVAAIGRMSNLAPIHRVDLDSSIVARRFSIEQGRNADGSVKIRSVDDETACGTNTCVKPAEKLTCDGLDVIFALAALCVSLGNLVVLESRCKICVQACASAAEPAVDVMGRSLG